MHSRDITILIILLWFSIVHYSSLFLHFFDRSTIIPTLVENSNILVDINNVGKPLCTACCYRPGISHIATCMLLLLTLQPYFTKLILSQLKTHFQYNGISLCWIHNFIMSMLLLCVSQYSLHILKWHWFPFLSRPWHIFYSHTFGFFVWSVYTPSTLL